MKSITRLLLAASALFLLASCGDTHEKVVNEQIAVIEEMSETMNNYYDGKISAKDAAEKLVDLEKKGDKLDQRLKDLGDEPVDSAEYAELKVKAAEAAVGYLEASFKGAEQGDFAKAAALGKAMEEAKK